MLDALFVQEVANFYDGFFSRLELVGEPLSDVEFDKQFTLVATSQWRLFVCIN